MSEGPPLHLPEETERILELMRIESAISFNLGFTDMFLQILQLKLQERESGIQLDIPTHIPPDKVTPILTLLNQIDSPEKQAEVLATMIRSSAHSFLRFFPETDGIELTGNFTVRSDDYDDHPTHTHISLDEIRAYRDRLSIDIQSLRNKSTK